MASNRRAVVMPDSQIVTLAMEDQCVSGAHQWGVVHARLIDDITHQPVTVPTTLQVRQGGLTPRITEDGLIGLVGIPLNVFPRLDNQAYQVDFTVRAQGYQPRTLSVPIPRQQATISSPGFPFVFTPVDFGDIHLNH